MSKNTRIFSALLVLVMLISTLASLSLLPVFADEVTDTEDQEESAVEENKYLTVEESIEAYLTDVYESAQDKLDRDKNLKLRLTRGVYEFYLNELTAEIALKMPDDNQVAIVDGNIVVFNQAKFENLFQYDYKSQVIAEAKARELTEKYKLSFAEGLTLDSLLADKKPILKKVQAMDIAEEMPQDKLLEYADEMQLELMTDDDGSIIIMDDKDLTMFVNLLNEDYYVSPVNGKRYEIKSKKLLGEPDGEPPRG